MVSPRLWRAAAWLIIRALPTIRWPCTRSCWPCRPWQPLLPAQDQAVPQARSPVGVAPHPPRCTALEWELVAAVAWCPVAKLRPVWAQAIHHWEECTPVWLAAIRWCRPMRAWAPRRHHRARIVTKTIPRSTLLTRSHSLEPWEWRHSRACRRQWMLLQPAQEFRHPPR